MYRSVTRGRRKEVRPDVSIDPRASADGLKVAAAGASHTKRSYAMTSMVLNVTFDCADPGSVARFWAAVTGWALEEQDPSPGHAEFSVGPPTSGGQRLYFVA